MQNAFIKPGGFGEFLGNNVSRLQGTIEPTKRVLETARKTGVVKVIHTREGHRSDLADCPPSKL